MKPKKEKIIVSIFSKEQLNSISVMTCAYYDYQRERTALDGRLGIKKSGDKKKGSMILDDSIINLLLARRDNVLSVEKEIEQHMAKIIKQHPLWPEFFNTEVCNGVGPMMAAVIISEFNIHKAKYVSNLWSFSGLAPGKDRKEKEKKCPFNQFLRAKLCGVLGGSFLKCKDSYYGKFYYDMKHRLESSDWGTLSKNPTDPKRPKAGHQHKAANRYMIKMFLKDLYVAWRTLENLPVAEPYQEKYLGHKHQEVAA